MSRSAAEPGLSDVRILDLSLPDWVLSLAALIDSYSKQSSSDRTGLGQGVTGQWLYKSKFFAKVLPHCRWTRELAWDTPEEFSMCG